MEGSGEERASFIRPLMAALLWAVSAYLIQIILHAAGVFPEGVSADNLYRWDAGWYHRIVREGYDHGSKNTGFFPLLPWLWKATGFSALGISIVNAGLFCIGFAFLGQALRLETRHYPLLLSIPSLYFVLVPYSEALFFLLCSLLIWGIVRRVRPMIWAALIVVGFARATAMMLLPALIALSLLSRPRDQWLAGLRETFLHYVVPSLLGLGLFVIYQWSETGVWFAYFKQQSTAWGHTFAWPTFPFDDPHGYRLLLINALGTAVNTALVVWLTVAGVKWLWRGKAISTPMMVLAAGYATGVLFLLTFYQPIWETGHTNIYGTHRYSFCVPFFMTAIKHVADLRHDRPLIIALVWLACSIITLSYGSYLHINTWLAYNIVAIGPMLYAIYAWRRSRIVWATIALTGFAVQAVMFQQFLRGMWPD